MSTTRTQVVKFIRKGDHGDKGEQGAALRGPQMWKDCATGYAFQAGVAAQQWKDVVIYNDNYYSCVKAHTKTESNYPGSTDDVNNHYWQLSDKIEIVAANILLATYALIKNLGVEALEMTDSSGNTVVKIKDGNVVCNTGTFENVTISGKLKGVTGSFKTLNCVDSNGKVVGNITFGTDGRLWFSGDMYHQGYNYTDDRSYRFYTSDLWCRGTFGASQRNILEVKGSYGYYYTKGAYKSGVYVAFTSKTSAQGVEYYQLPLIGTDNDYAGFPVDIVVFNHNNSTVYNYELVMDVTQRALVVNGNNNHNNVKIFANGILRSWNGGEVAEVVNLFGFMTPAPDTDILGRGLIIGAFRDNDW